MNRTLDRKLHPETILRIVGVAFFAYLFFGFMLLPCLNTLTSIFNTKNAAGERDPFAVIRFFLAGSMGKYVWNSLKLAVLLVLFFTRNHTRFKGEIFFRYLILYGIGRFFIEGLRTDQLLLGGTSVPVSQLLSAVLAAGSLIVTVYFREKNKKKASA